MSAVVVPFRRPVRFERADGAAQAVYLAALRMGYSAHLALRASRQARKDVLKTQASGASVVSRLSAELRLAARRSKA